jgi:hypothetical protein
MSWQKASYVSENSHEMLCDMTHTDTQTVWVFVNRWRGTVTHEALTEESCFQRRFTNPDI